MGRDFPQALQGLLRVGAYRHSVKAVKVITTHLSWVLLTGDFAYKIKRPVQYPFVDLRAQEQRAFLCREELRLNRRFAPELYLEVCPITLDGGQAHVGGPGPVVEHAVKMRQFPEAERLDRLLEEGRIEASQLRAFGADLARIHDQLPSARPTQAWGQPAAAGAVIIENLEQCARAADEAWNTDEEVQSLRDPLFALIESSAALLSKRFADGRVRDATATCIRATLFALSVGSSLSIAWSSTRPCAGSTWQMRWRFCSQTLLRVARTSMPMPFAAGIWIKAETSKPVAFSISTRLTGHWCARKCFC